ncbi:MAG: hypothetical protein SFW67_27080 [Myxococcaceae bacterium]|nr:hypothetical protein [Myxococcaceae bacterium]
MLTLLTALLLGQSGLKVAVVDVSAADAIYEDISRELTQRVADELLGRGFSARRVDESELPVEGCRLGPCLGEIAKSQGADVLVIVDATEGAKGKVDVVLSAMRGRDGLPLAAGRWGTTTEGKKGKQLTKFVEATWKAAARHVTVPP